MKESCETCQYFRQGRWCSNSQAMHFRLQVNKDDWCVKYAQRGQKAPRVVRVANNVLTKVVKIIKK